MSHFKAKMHQIVCRLGLCPRPRVFRVFTYFAIGPWPSLQNRSSAHGLTCTVPDTIHGAVKQL